MTPTHGPITMACWHGDHTSCSRATWPNPRLCRCRCHPAPADAIPATDPASGDTP